MQVSEFLLHDEIVRRYFQLQLMRKKTEKLKSTKLFLHKLLVKSILLLFLLVFFRV